MALGACSVDIFSVVAVLLSPGIAGVARLWSGTLLSGCSSASTKRGPFLSVFSGV